MNNVVDVITNDVVVSVIKIIVICVIIAHIISILIIQKQIHQADRVGTQFAHRLLEFAGYINIILLGIIFILLLLPNPNG